MPAVILALLLALLAGRNPHVESCIQDCATWPDGRTVCTDVQCPTFSPGRC